MAARTGRPIGQHPKEREAMRAASLMRRLSDYTFAVEPDDESTEEEKLAYKRLRMNPGQIQAGLGILKKLVPDLAATEMTVTDERDAMSEEQLIEKLRELVLKSPELKRELLASEPVLTIVKGE